MSNKIENKNIEMMKKLIEEKKRKASQGGNSLRPERSIGGTRKAIRNKKTGGLFDK
ncbi:hypothetical protein [Haloimpatiens lingqiaonensis]|uniref:hypothetical protein n=1 Tax=Haloimpatiens lingqiaonensis TaxID=1380675 RepID=UPI0014858D70|nr:hypothetical protein [Haloimpatiens lingqiaonensis]